MLKTAARLACLLACVSAIVACSSARYRTVTVPPRVDLKPHETIGVIQFTSESAGDLAPLATRRFTESARRDQGLVRMLNVGTEQQALAEVHGGSLRDPETLREIGRQHGVQTMLVGQLIVSDVKPDLNISAAFKSGSVTAKVDATLSVELIETATGASLWSGSARATRTVAHVGVFNGGHWTFDAADPNEAYGDLIDALVEGASRDFHAGWTRVRVQ